MVVSLGGLGVDPLFRIRKNLLSSLFIGPEHNGKKFLTSRRFTRAAAKLESGAGADPADRFKWSQPCSFPIHADGRVSQDLLTFLRVAAIATKAEAAEALKQCDAVRKAVVTAREAARERAFKRHQAKLAARAAKGAAGEAAGAAAADGGDSDSDSDDDDDDEITMALPPLSASNEAVVQSQVAAVLATTFTYLALPARREGGGAVDRLHAAAAGLPVAPFVYGDDLDASTADASPFCVVPIPIATVTPVTAPAVELMPAEALERAPAEVASSPVALYLHSQRTMLQRAIVKQRAEATATAVAASAGGAGAAALSGALAALA